VPQKSSKTNPNEARSLAVVQKASKANPKKATGLAVLTAELDDSTEDELFWLDAADATGQRKGTVVTNRSCAKEVG
jgi:hypothetical protein